MTDSSRTTPARKPSKQNARRETSVRPDFDDVWSGSYGAVAGSRMVRQEKKKVVVQQNEVSWRLAGLIPSMQSCNHARLEVFCSSTHVKRMDQMTDVVGDWIEWPNSLDGRKRQPSPPSRLGQDWRGWWLLVAIN